jgi:ParB family chromosome partitioning protein
MSANLRKKLAGKTTKLSRPSKELIADHPAKDNFVTMPFRMIPVEALSPDPDQPRQEFNKEPLQELSDSIKQHGVIQPINIRIDENNKIWIVAGERRWRAAKMAALDEVPCFIKSGDPAVISLIENIQREDLNPIEEAEAYSLMIDRYGYTQEELGQVIGKKRTTITQTLSLNKLPEEIKKQCPRADVPKRVLIEIARKEDPKEMINLFNRVKSGEFQSDDVRKEVRKRTKRTTRTPSAIALDRVFSLSNTLEKLNLNTSNESERVDLLAALNHLRKIIENKYFKD